MRSGCQPPRADDKHARSLQALLALPSDLFDKKVPLVALDLIRREDGPPGGIVHSAWLLFFQPSI